MGLAVRRQMSLKGVGIPDGLGLGHVVMHQPRVTVSRIVADDVESELIRLETAISAMRASVDDLIDRNDDGVGGEHRDVLEAFRMIAGIVILVIDSNVWYCADRAMCLRSANTSFLGAHVAAVASPPYSLKELSSAAVPKSFVEV